jgi:regulatory protein
MADPVITRIERQQRAKHRVSIYLDGDFAFGMDDEVAFRFGLARGMTLTPDLRGEIERATQRVDARSTAERLLAGRMRSEKELRTKLQSKGIGADVIDETIAMLVRVQLIDDRAFAVAWVRDRLRLKPRSSAALRRELLAKGIAAGIIVEVLAAECGEDGDESLARRVAGDYQRRHPAVDPLALRRRLAAHLFRKGFSADVVYRVTGEVVSEGV